MDKLRLQGYKCFTDETLCLNKLTLLTGNNGSGKSSVIQSLLLLRQVVEKCMPQKVWVGGEISLNDYRELRLGTFDDVCNVNADGIKLSINDALFDLEQGSSNSMLSVDVEGKGLPTLPDYLTRTEFYYLNAERIGPRTESRIQKSSLMDCGNSGEWTGNVLLDASRSFPKVEKERLFNEDSTNNFNIQVDQWMSYIFSEISIKTEPLTQQTCQIKLRGPKVTTTTPNTGFGYTYSLPIVVNGLLAAPGSCLIIENPEAHLHPKAQSNMGFFIGKMVAAGLHLVVETHSEHIINGIRRATLSSLGLSPADVSIYFFTRNREECPYTEITIDNEGNLSDFPVDFFDQVRQDMMEIIRLAQQNKNTL